MAEWQGYSTRGVPPGDRLKVWRFLMGEVFCDLDVTAREPASFAGSISRRTFGSLTVSRVRGSTTRVHRTARAIRSDGVENFHFVFPQTGFCEHRQRGAETRSAPGDLFVVNTAERYEIDRLAGAAVLCLSVPGDLVRQRVKGIDDAIRRGCLPRSTVTTALDCLTGHSLDRGLAADDGRAEALCLDMIEVALAPAPPERGIAPPMGRNR